nr:hypothetical protein [Haliangium ochraceum]
MGNLLEDQDDADGGQQTADDGVGEVVGDAAAAQQTDGELHDAGQDHGGEQQLEAAERGQRRQDDGDEAGGRSRHAGVRAADAADDEAADDAGDETAHQRYAGGERDTETERQRDQEDCDGARDVFA